MTWDPVGCSSCCERYNVIMNAVVVRTPVKACPHQQHVEATGNLSPIVEHRRRRKISSDLLLSTCFFYMLLVCMDGVLCLIHTPVPTRRRDRTVEFCLCELGINSWPQYVVQVWDITWIDSLGRCCCATKDIDHAVRWIVTKSNRVAILAEVIIQERLYASKQAFLAHQW